MNKKAYHAPELTTVVSYTTQHLLQGTVNGDKPTNGLGEGVENGGDDPGDFSRRGRSQDFWDDEY